ncbi:FixH family protein [Mangrovibacterium sp.]|uniref:FixH family protein n=1 Tax=Mangrovibacterium sp. TaxID=1961364 RepID=UPI00356ABC55
MKPFKFNWGTGIIIAMIVMMSGMLYLVYLATSQDYFLVEKDYYQKGINYQEQIDKINNTNSLREKPQLTLSGQELMVQLPAWFSKKNITGSVFLYSAVNDFMDQKITFTPDSQLQQTISVSQIPAGQYTIKLEWTANNTPYYWEQKITLE